MIFYCNLHSGVRSVCSTPAVATFYRKRPSVNDSEVRQSFTVPVTSENLCNGNKHTVFFAVRYSIHIGTDGLRVLCISHDALFSTYTSPHSLESFDSSYVLPQFLHIMMYYSEYLPPIFRKLHLQIPRLDRQTQ